MDSTNPLLSPVGGILNYGPYEIILNMLLAFVLAMIIACLGLFGLSTFMAQRRTKEIGIRKALGSSIPQIFILLAKDFLKWVAYRY